MKLSACLLFALPLIAAAQPLAESAIQVRSTVAPAGATLQSKLTLTDRPDGSRVVEVRLTNATGADVQLQSAEIEFPWVTATGKDFLVSCGATIMSHWPIRVIDPATDKTEPWSGIYLLARNGGSYSLVSFLSWQTFWSKLHYRDGRIVVTADGEGRIVRAGETVALEKVRLTAGSDWQDLLFNYADAVARELRITLKPRPHYVGWSTWDYYGAGWRAEDVTRNVDAIVKLVPESNLIQIDGGWWPHRGDYQDLRPDLRPDGMKRLAEAIRAHHLTAGIHLDGMRAASDADTVRDHPDYFLHDNQGVLLKEIPVKKGGASNARYDFSNPATRDYFRESLRRIRRDWGYDYFKIDWLRTGIAEEVRQSTLHDDPKRSIVPFDRHLTSVERLHLALAAFREGIGNDAYLIGCSAAFGPTFGQVDGLRTGPDIGPRFPAYQSCSKANAGNFYLHGKVIYTDADYEVVRAKEDQDPTMTKEGGKNGGDLKPNEAEMWTDYVALFGGTKLASDNLLSLREERKELVRFALTQPSCSRFVPLDYWEHARGERTDAFQVFLGATDTDVYLALFNWGDAARTYQIAGLSADALRDRLRGTADVTAAGKGAQVVLQSRHATIFRLPKGTDFDHTRKTIVVH